MRRGPYMTVPPFATNVYILSFPVPPNICQLHNKLLKCTVGCMPIEDNGISSRPSHRPTITIPSRYRTHDGTCVSLTEFPRGYER